MTYQVPRWFFFHQYFSSVWDLYFLLSICLLTHNFLGRCVFCSLAYHSVFCHLQSFSMPQILEQRLFLFLSPSCTKKYFAHSYICDDTIGAPHQQPFFGATEGATAIYSRGWARERKKYLLPAAAAAAGLFNLAARSYERPPH